MRSEIRIGSTTTLFTERTVCLPWRHIEACRLNPESNPSHVRQRALRGLRDEERTRYQKRVRSRQEIGYRVCTWNHGAATETDCRYDGSMRRREPPAMGRTLPTLKRAWPKDGPLAAICVQNVDVQCVLQFTLIHAAGCVLHRRTSRVIHRLKLFSFCLTRKPIDEGSRQFSL